MSHEDHETPFFAAPPRFSCDPSSIADAYSPLSFAQRASDYRPRRIDGVQRVRELGRVRVCSFVVLSASIAAAICDCSCRLAKVDTDALFLSQKSNKLSSTPFFSFYVTDSYALPPRLQKSRLKGSSFSPASSDTLLMVG